MKASFYTKETILNIGVFERNFPKFKSGDTIAVTVKFNADSSGEKKKESKITRNQVFTGIVLAVKNKGISKTFIVRKIIDGVAVERVFPYYSPNIISVEVKEEGLVRRAKLYYLRERFGKKNMVKRKKKEATVLLKKNRNNTEKVVSSGEVPSVDVSQVDFGTKDANKTI